MSFNIGDRVKITAPHNGVPDKVVGKFGIIVHQTLPGEGGREAWAVAIDGDNQRDFWWCWKTQLVFEKDGLDRILDKL